MNNHNPESIGGQTALDSNTSNTPEYRAVFRSKEEHQKHVSIVFQCDNIYLAVSSATVALMRIFGAYIAGLELVCVELVEPRLDARAAAQDKDGA